MRAPLILILAAALALLLQLTLHRSPDVVGDPPSRARLALSARQVPETPVRTAYAAQINRSPFDLLRGGATPTEASTDSFSLIGLIRSGASASAVVRDPAGGGHVLRPGDSLQGWRLDGVGRDDVTLSRGADRRTLTLNGPPAVLTRTSP